MKNTLKLQLRTYADTYKVRLSATKKLLAICEAENKHLRAERDALREARETGEGS